MLAEVNLIQAVLTIWKWADKNCKKKTQLCTHILSGASEYKAHPLKLGS